MSPIKISDLYKATKSIEDKTKIDPTIPVYEGPELNKKEFTCAGCIMFLRDVSQCTVVKPKQVDGNGGCNVWIGGESTTSREHPSMELVPKNVVNYLDDGPFTCKRCANFSGVKNKGGTGTCRIVAGLVHKDGCCNAWKKREHKDAV